jgi:integrase
MSREVNRLSPAFVASHKTPGYYADGGNLYLQISKAGTKSWVIRYRLFGRRRDMGLGVARDVSLKEARDKALAARKQVKDGVDPIDERRIKKAQLAAEKAQFVTFSEATAAYLKSNEASWKSRKHRLYWESTLRRYAFDVLGKMPVRDIKREHVLRVLEPIWRSKTATATRIRQRIELVLGYAQALDWCEGPNAALWRNGLDKILPKPKSLYRAKHFAALPYEKVGALVEQLQGHDSTAARALEFLILTASRTGEVRYARFAEFNLDEALWVIPPERMKGRQNEEREHRVPLSARAVEIVRAQRKLAAGEIVFEGSRAGKPMSNVALWDICKSMDVDEGTTVHGMRAAFRSWAAAKSTFPREVAEAALAHVVGDETESAYQRDDLLIKRSLLMDAWSKYCASPLPEGHVVPFTSARSD